MFSKLFKTHGQIEIVLQKDTYELLISNFEVKFGKKTLSYQLTTSPKATRNLKRRFYKKQLLNFNKTLTYGFIQQGQKLVENPYKKNIFYYLSGANKVFDKNLLHFQSLTERAVVGKKEILRYIDLHDNLAIESDIDNRITITF